MKRKPNILELVWNAYRAFRLWEFLRDHYDDWL